MERQYSPIGSTVQPYRWVSFGTADDLVQPALRRSVSGVGARGADIALGGGHRFVTQQVHQDVHADICVGQFGGKGMSKTVQQSTFRAGTVDPGLSESEQDAILQGSAGDALAVVADEQGR